MTPKQQCDQLVQKFYDIHPSLFSIANYAVRMYFAKRSALLCAQMIILANPHSNPLNTDVHSTFEYWNEVKNEIEKI